MIGKGLVCLLYLHISVIPICGCFLVLFPTLIPQASISQWVCKRPWCHTIHMNNIWFLQGNGPAGSVRHMKVTAMVRWSSIKYVCICWGGDEGRGRWGKLTVFWTFVPTNNFLMEFGAIWSQKKFLINPLIPEGPSKVLLGLRLRKWKQISSFLPSFQKCTDGNYPKYNGY